MNAASLFAQNFHELHDGRSAFGGEWIDAEQMLGQFHCWLGRSIDLKTTPNHPISIRLGVHNMTVIVFYNFDRPGGRDNELFSTLAAIQTSIAEIRHVVEPRIVNDPKDIWWGLDHHGFA
jgi:hypothetical protein